MKKVEFALKGKATSVDVLIGENLRKIRAASGMSQMALAERLGLSFHQIQKYEKGVNRISAATLYAIICIFGVQSASFFEGLPLPRPVRSGESGIG